MIMIIGSQHDDILYFESVMSNKREEIVLEKTAEILQLVRVTDDLTVEALFFAKIIRQRILVVPPYRLVDDTVSVRPVRKVPDQPFLKQHLSAVVPVVKPLLVVIAMNNPDLLKASDVVQHADQPGEIIVHR